MTWASTVEVISVLVSTSTSPLSVSTMRVAGAAAHQRLGADRDLLDAGLDQLLDQLGVERPCPPATSGSGAAAA